MQSTNSTQPGPHITFDEVSKQVHNLRDLILWDIQQGFDKRAQDPDDDSFTNHLMFTKYWFIRVSSVNKKRFCIVLLEDMPCAWALSLLLKSIWNCRPKDAVASQYEATVWSSYDQVPMDHNRSALPILTLTEVMEADRFFFRSLEAHRKAEFLLELLQIAGGPIVWAVFQRAHTIFENYREDQLNNILACIEVVHETQTIAAKIPPPGDDKSKKDPKRKMSASGDYATPTKQAATQDAQKELEVYLAQWTAIIKSVKDTQKLEEVELSFSDGTKQRIWKVNRPKPEVTETEDYFQLLPQSVAKRVLNYVPRAQLADCARVNRYWTYLVDEFKAELAARLKIDMDIEKLTELMLRHDINDQTMDTFKTLSSTEAFSVPVSHSHQYQRLNYSKHGSLKSGTANVFMKPMLRDAKVNKLPPIRNLKQLSERLDRRGAADDNLWNWCKIVLERYNPKDKYTLPPLPHKLISKQDGVMDFGNIHFPCPLMSMNLKLPLKPPLCKDFTTSYLHRKDKRTNINASKINLSKYTKKGCKRYNLWSRDFSSLYTALKIPNYKSPV